MPKSLVAGHPEIVQRIRSGLAQARHMMIDANCLRKDGTAFSAEVTVSLIDLLDPGDLVFTIRNTERRRRQIDAFRTKENAYAVSQAALFACGADGRFKSVNATFREMFGFETDDDALRAEFCEVFDDEPMAKLFERALKGETVGVRLTAQEGDIDSQDVEVQLAPDVHGKKTVGVVGSVVRI